MTSAPAATTMPHPSRTTGHTITPDLLPLDCGCMADGDRGDAWTDCPACGTTWCLADDGATTHEHDHIATCGAYARLVADSLD